METVSKLKLAPITFINRELQQQFCLGTVRNTLMGGSVLVQNIGPYDEPQTGPMNHHVKSWEDPEKLQGEAKSQYPVEKIKNHLEALHE